MYIAIYNNRVTKETYRLAGVATLEQAYKPASFAASRMGWNFSMFSYDVSVALVK